MQNSFSLHPILAADTHHVKDLRLCRVLLMDDARFPWLILVPMRNGMREVFELSAQDQQTLMQEISYVAKAFQRHAGAFKMNVAALGNMVPQLHVHIIARFETDCGWPSPVWSAHAPRSRYTPETLTALLRDLQAML